MGEGSAGFLPGCQLLQVVETTEREETCTGVDWDPHRVCLKTALPHMYIDQEVFVHHTLK